MRFTSDFPEICSAITAVTHTLELVTSLLCFPDTGHVPPMLTDKWSALFFLFFIVVGSFFVMNLFVGVTIDKFNEMKEKQEVSAQSQPDKDSTSRTVSPPIRR